MTQHQRTRNWTTYNTHSLLPCVIKRVEPSTPRSNVSEVGQQHHCHKYQTSTGHYHSKKQPPKLPPSQPSLEVLEQTIGIQQGKDACGRHVLARSDWLETDEGYLHGHDETEEVKGNIGYVDSGEK